jgi:hypothetical protein
MAILLCDPEYRSCGQMGKDGFTERLRNIHGIAAMVIIILAEIIVPDDQIGMRIPFGIGSAASSTCPVA